MEGNNNISTTLSAGVASRVSSPTLSSRGNGESEVSTSNKVVSITENRQSNSVIKSSDRNVIASPASQEKQSQGDLKEKVVSIRHAELDAAFQERSEPSSIKSNKEFADDLFETAKTDGTETAFQKLADGGLKAVNNRHSELDSESQTSDTDYNSQPDGEVKNQDKETDEESPAQVKEEPEREKTEFTMPIEMRVRQLESQISKLVEENKDLAKKADEAQAMAKAGITTALELAQVLKALIEGEEEEKKKKHVGLLEILARLIAQMLIMITVPEDQQEKAMEGINGKAQQAQAA